MSISRKKLFIDLMRLNIKRLETQSRGCLLHTELVLGNIYCNGTDFFNIKHGVKEKYSFRESIMVGRSSKCKCC